MLWIRSRQGFEEEADFGRIGVIEVGVVGQGGVAGAVQDGLEDRDEYLQPARTSPINWGGTHKLALCV